MAYRHTQTGTVILAICALIGAVELKLTNGDIKRIGTDDPHGLATALKA